MLSNREKTNRPKGVGKNTNPLLFSHLYWALLTSDEMKGRVNNLIDLGAGSGQHLDLWRSVVREYNPMTLVHGTDLPGNVAKSENLDLFYDLAEGFRLTHSGVSQNLVLSSNVLNVQETYLEFSELCWMAGQLGSMWLVNYPKEPRKMTIDNLPTLFRINGWKVIAKPEPNVFLLERNY